MARETINDLIALLAVARERSFTRAAAQLGVSQPALSRIIRDLEARLGLRLLTRNTRSVAPTEAGERLIQTVGPHFDGIEAGLAAVTAMRGKPAGSLRITSVEHASDTILAPAVARLLTDYPDIRVEIINDYGCRRPVRCRRAFRRTGRQGHDRVTDWTGLPTSSRRRALLLRPALPTEHATRLDGSCLH
jgi:DNA-binding transcriptional LysR family regulator